MEVFMESYKHLFEVPKQNTEAIYHSAVFQFECIKIPKSVRDHFDVIASVSLMSDERLKFAFCKAYCFNIPDDFKGSNTKKCELALDMVLRGYREWAAEV
jgi:hypothetical protein